MLSIGYNVFSQKLDWTHTFDTHCTSEAIAITMFSIIITVTHPETQQTCCN